MSYKSRVLWSRLSYFPSRWQGGDPAEETCHQKRFDPLSRICRHSDYIGVHFENMGPFLQKHIRIFNDSQSTVGILF